MLFDVNETLSDMSPIGQRFVDVGAPAHLAATWFAALLSLDPPINWVGGVAARLTGNARLFGRKLVLPQNNPTEKKGIR